MRARARCCRGFIRMQSVAALALAINNALGNVGKTVFVASEPAVPLPSDQIADIKALVADLNAGKVDWLVILNSNPIYDAPADLDFAVGLQQGEDGGAPGRACRRDGTDRALAHSRGALSRVVVGRARYDGTVSVVQPLIDPLYGGKSAHDVLQALLDEPMLSAYDAVRVTQKATIKGDFETGWRKALHDGWIADTAYDKSGSAKPASLSRSRAVAEGFDRDHLPARSEYL